MYYINEVRATEEHATKANEIAPKELALATQFVEAIAAPFQAEEVTDRYREQLEALIASKETMPVRDSRQAATSTGKIVDIMDALRKSLERAEADKRARKPVTRAVPPAKSRKRRA